VFAHFFSEPWWVYLVHTIGRLTQMAEGRLVCVVMNRCHRLDYCLCRRIALLVLVIGCAACGGKGNSDNANSADSPSAPTLTLETQPASQAVGAGMAATFSVSVKASDAYRVQWQARLPSGMYADIVGATSTSFTIASASLAQTGTLIRARISCGNVTIDSLEATLTVGVRPIIISGLPVDVLVLAGEPALFSVEAFDLDSYQWQKKPAGAPDSAFSDISGATLRQYEFVADIVDNGSAFRVVAHNVYGNVASRSAILSVVDKVTSPIIMASPTSVRSAAGFAATFQVVASGIGPLIYQWQERRSTAPEFIDIAGATLASYTIFNLTNDLNGAQFRVRVSNAAGSTISEAATLAVDPVLLTWIQVSPDPQQLERVTGGYFSDSENGVLVGNGVSVFTTSDGGATWLARDSNIPGSSKNVYFVDRRNGWIVSNGGGFTYTIGPLLYYIPIWGAVAKTTDGGATWQRMDAVPQNVTDPFLDFEDVYFHNVNTGWIVGARGQIYKTDDSGINWIKQESLTPERLVRVRFVNAQRGFVLGIDSISRQLFVLQTANGGTTWTRTNLVTLTESEFSHTIGDMGFETDQRGWATIGNCAYGTSDGGVTWAMTGCVDENIVSMVPSGNGLLYVKCDSENLYVSADGGTTFTKIAGGWRGHRYISQQRLFMSSNKTIWRTSPGAPVFAPPPSYVVLP
jgi:photosystem II stability/assembly factor-like uncharacterized protein